MTPAIHKNIDPPNPMQEQPTRPSCTPAGARNGWNEPPMYIGGHGGSPVLEDLILGRTVRRGTTVSPEDSISQAINRMDQRPHASRRHKHRMPMQSTKDHPAPPPSEDSRPEDEEDEEEEEPTVVLRSGRREAQSRPLPSKRAGGARTTEQGIPSLALPREPQARDASVGVGPSTRRADTMHAKPAAHGRDTGLTAKAKRRPSTPSPAPPSVSCSASHSPSQRHDHDHTHANPHPHPHARPFPRAPPGLEPRLKTITTHLHHLQNQVSALQRKNWALEDENAELVRAARRLGRVAREENQARLRREEVAKMWREKAREMAGVWGEIVALEI